MITARRCWQPDNQAISDKTPLVIQGSNSKAFLGRPVTGQT
ncbi:hypothetical protein ACLBR5_07805 [Escherichia coli]